jgi:hypothetical protein
MFSVGAQCVMTKSTASRPVGRVEQKGLAEQVKNAYLVLDLYERLRSPQPAQQDVVWRRA